MAGVDLWALVSFRGARGRCVTFGWKTVEHKELEQNSAGFANAAKRHTWVRKRIRSETLN